jgi:protein-disulfide isomerase
VARLPKKKKATPAKKGPSGRMVVLAFAIAIAAAAALVAAALLLRSSEDAVEPNPTPSVELDGIAQDGMVLGADAANVTLIEYADLQCPFCRGYSESVFPVTVDEYVRPGRVKTELRALAFIGEDSENARRFVYAASLQDRAWQLQEALFRNQGSENSGWVTDELVRTLAEQIEGLDVDRLFEDAETQEVIALGEQATSQAEAAGVRGTPTFYIRIGDEEPYQLELGAFDPAEFRSALDDALEG